MSAVVNLCLHVWSSHLDVWKGPGSELRANRPEDHPEGRAGERPLRQALQGHWVEFCGASSFLQSGVRGLKPFPGSP